MTKALWDIVCLVPKPPMSPITKPAKFENQIFIMIVMGKLEEQPPTMRASEHYTPWHGHITVLTVAPAWRRLGYARRLTESLEHASDVNDAWFVDLYVRAGNRIAVDMYKRMG